MVFLYALLLALSVWISVAIGIIIAVGFIYMITPVPQHEQTEMRWRDDK